MYPLKWNVAQCAEKAFEIDGEMFSNTVLEESGQGYFGNYVSGNRCGKNRL